MDRILPLSYSLLFLLCLALQGEELTSEKPDSATESPQPTAAQLQALQTFLDSPSLEVASVSFCLIPLEALAEEGTAPRVFKKPTPLLSHNADRALIPASTLKAVTTATALQVLGPEYSFQTHLYLKGEDLIIKGGGDPLLASSSLNVEFPAWLKALQEKGVSEIKGKLIADPTHFESRTTPNEWPWGDIGNYYGAGASGLNFHHNSYQITFKPGSVGGTAKLTATYPTPPGVTFQNYMLTGTADSGDQGYAYVSPGGAHVTFRGTVPAGRSSFSIKGALPNPALSCVTAFKAYLEKNDFPVQGGVEVSEKTLSVTEEERIYTQASPPLHKLLIPTNQRSVNLNAESIFKALTEEGTAQDAVKKVTSHWAAQSVDMTGFQIQDGSGLSPRNTVTARQLAMIMLRAHQHPTASQFKKSLATAGRTGTLTYFGKGTAAEGRVIGKSGGLTRVRCYTGYLNARSGASYAFAVMTNNHHLNTKPAIVNLLAQLASQ